jgi:hypoxanthine phosphoribosyltransferase
MTDNIYHSAYFASILNPAKLKKVIRKLCENIKEFQKTTKVDAIAIRGLSGSLIGGILSHKLGIPLMCVRKGKSHSDYRVETFLTEYKPEINYIIIDDLICSGGTIKAIIKEVKREFKKINSENVDEGLVQMKPVPKGIFLYNDSSTAWVNHDFGTTDNPIPVKSFNVNAYK